MDAPARHSFTVRYDDDVVRDAIRTFIWRRGVAEQKLMWLGAALTGLAAILLFLKGDTGWMTGLLLALTFLPAPFLGLLWRAHHANTFGRLRQMKQPKADIVLDAEGIGLSSDLGSGQLSWHAITEIWERPGAFMLLSGRATFNTLPRAGMPAEVEAELSRRARAGRTIRG